MSNWIQTISTAIDSAFKNARPIMSIIPPLILLCGVTARRGLSTIAVVANIIRRQPEAGAYTGLMPDGSPNIMERWASIIVDEVLKEIRTNCRIQISIAPGAITCYGVANGPAGPMPVFSVNTNVVSGHGASF